MKLIATLAAATSLLVLSGCNHMPFSKSISPEMAEMEKMKAEAMEAALMAQPDEAKARYDARNPAQTLTFFGIEPGMTVVEALPGGGWYTKILMPYVGEEGTIIGANYPDSLWPNFGFGDEWVAERIAGTAGWTDTAEEWAGENGPEVSSYQLTKMPADMEGTADAVLFIRALHNLNRFDEGTGYMTDSLAEAYRVLKPGGIVGVVQHKAPESASDEWADGSKGYLKESDLIAKFEAAGFELSATSDMNNNPKDMPGAEDFVWRLPPTLAGTEEDTPERAAMEAIGESNRMTLVFAKPG